MSRLNTGISTGLSEALNRTWLNSGPATSKRAIQQALIESDTQMGTASLQDQLARDQMAQRQKNLSQLYKLIGLDSLGEGGLLGQNLFGSFLGSDIDDIIDPIAGAAGGAVSPQGGPSGAGMGQPGFAEQPGNIPIQQHNEGSANGGGLFDQLLSSRSQLGQSILGDISQFGESQRSQIDRDFSNTRGTTLANLESRGLGSSSLAPAAESALQESRQQSMLNLEDQLLGQQIGAKTQIGEGLFGSIEGELGRRNQLQQSGIGLIGGLIGSLGNLI